MPHLLAERGQSVTRFSRWWETAEKQQTYYHFSNDDVETRKAYNRHKTDDTTNNSNSAVILDDEAYTRRRSVENKLKEKKNVKNKKVESAKESFILLLEDTRTSSKLEVEIFVLIYLFMALRTLSQAQPTHNLIYLIKKWKSEA